VAAVAEILRLGVREGRIRADVRTEILASVLLGMLWAWSRDVEDSESPLRMETLVDLFRRGAEPKLRHSSEHKPRAKG
jgi:hypothetical protein